MEHLSTKHHNTETYYTPLILNQLNCILEEAASQHPQQLIQRLKPVNHQQNGKRCDPGSPVPCRVHPAGYLILKSAVSHESTRIYTNKTRYYLKNLINLFGIAAIFCKLLI
jgi:hypothetical protein